MSFLGHDVEVTRRRTLRLFRSSKGNKGQIITQLINAAIREYLERHRKPAQP